MKKARNLCHTKTTKATGACSGGFPYTLILFCRQKMCIRDRGCSVVEMECAAMATVAAFRNVKFAQFMWAADSLSGEKWDARNLNKLGTDAGEIYMEAAIRTLEYL